MRAALMLALAVVVAPVAGAASFDPVEVWGPTHWLIGTWKSLPNGHPGSARVTRIYASSPTNHHLEITEKGGGRARPAVSGMVSFDADRRVLVLRRFAEDGSASDAAFDPIASPTGPLVFASAASGAPVTRVTYERTGPKSFVERIERATDGVTFALVSETRFERRN